MKKLAFLSAAVLLIAVVMPTGVAFAESAKATVQVGNVAILNASSFDFTTVMSSSIRTSSQKDLIMSVALECGLFTRTKVSSKQGISDAASSAASVKVRVLIDGKQAHPGEVVFCRRTQELSATLGGIMQECRDVNLDGVIAQDECTWDPEEIELVLDSMNANSFGFALDDVGTGIHRIEVQARIDSGSSYQLGSADAKASIGKGSLSVEEVRLIKGEIIDF